MRFPLLAVLAGGLFAAELSPTEYIGYIKYLASPEMRGRATGSPELEKAAAFIREKFKSFKLDPISGTSYYQDFDVTTSAKLGTQNQIETSSLCTKCREDLFHSYRRDGKTMGHMLSVIGIAP